MISSDLQDLTAWCSPWESHPCRILSGPENSDRILSEVVGILSAGSRRSDPIGIPVFPTLSDSRIRLVESCRKDSDNFRQDLFGLLSSSDAAQWDQYWSCANWVNFGTMTTAVTETGLTKVDTDLIIHVQRLRISILISVRPWWSEVAREL